MNPNGGRRISVRLGFTASNNFRGIKGLERNRTMKSSSWFAKMSGTALTLKNLENVLTLQLRDLLSAEEQLISALPKMADAAVSPQLKRAFQTHLGETK